ncbi:MAG: alpha/beta hydrolase [Actinomycetota bacterium]
MRELTVRRGTVRLAARSFGNRGPHVILIHGLASTQHIWDLVVPLLERDFRVTTYDHRGHGESSRPSNYSFDEVCDDLAAVARAVGAKRPLVAGHSYGANVSIEYADRHPKAVAGVVCVDGGMGSMSEIMSWEEARVAAAPPPLAGVHIDEILAMVRRQVGRRWSPKMEHIARSLFFIDKKGHVKPCLSRANHMKILRAMYRQRPKELLARITMPTLMYCARPRRHVTDEERDFYEMKKRAVAEIRRSNPRVKIEWVTSIHDIPVDRPTELAERVKRFALRKVGPRAARRGG